MSSADLQMAAPGVPSGRKRPQSLRDKAYEVIKWHILTCAYRPGELINEAQVAQATGLGRTPVHQAFDRLSVEGLVDIMPRKGMVVLHVSLGEMMQLVPVRTANEALCARLAAEHANSGELDHLTKILDDGERATAERDTEKLLLLDRDFHATLAAASRNEILQDLLGKLHERCLRFWFLSLTAQTQREAVQREHADIVAALRARDPDRAEAAVRAHVASFHSSVSRLL